jgi:CheY-like chemotaxis protein
METIAARSSDRSAGSTVVCQPTEVFTVRTGREAIELLRLARFDLVLLSTALPDLPLWNLVKRIRAAWPAQKWALLLVSDEHGSPASFAASDEVIARTLGASAILEGEHASWPAILELADTIHQRQAAPAREVPHHETEPRRLRAHRTDVARTG